MFANNVKSANLEVIIYHTFVINQRSAICRYSGVTCLRIASTGVPFCLRTRLKISINCECHRNVYSRVLLLRVDKSHKFTVVFNFLFFLFSREIFLTLMREILSNEPNLLISIKQKKKKNDSTFKPKAKCLQHLSLFIDCCLLLIFKYILWRYAKSAFVECLK